MRCCDKGESVGVWLGRPGATGLLEYARFCERGALGASRYPMAGKLGAAQGLSTGLALAVAAVAALSTLSVAEPRWHFERAIPEAPQVIAAKEKRNSKSKAVAAPQDKKRQKTKAVAAPKDKKRAKAKAVSEPKITCSFPWSYSRALRHC